MHSCFIMLLYLYIIIISLRLAGHSTLLTTSSHIPETKTKFPHSWMQLKIHLQIQIQSPYLSCFAFVNHAYSKHKYIYKFNQRVWSCDDFASIRMCCESNQNLIFLKCEWRVELSCSRRKDRNISFQNVASILLAWREIQKLSIPLFWQYCG